MIPLYIVQTVDFRARGIKFRQANDEPVAGYFSQIGELYAVHHIWGEFI